MRLILAPSIALAAVLALTLPALAETPADKTAAEVRAADRAFNDAAQKEGIAAAFRDFMDETDGLVFGGPRPMRGTAMIYRLFGGGAPDKVTLTWTPTAAWGSAGGDMGVTTGDWMRTPKDPSKAKLTGRYVTVWRKNANGQWRGLIDIGETDEVTAK